MRILALVNFLGRSIDTPDLRAVMHEHRLSHFSEGRRTIGESLHELYDVQASSGPDGSTSSLWLEFDGIRFYFRHFGWPVVAEGAPPPVHPRARTGDDKDELILVSINIREAPETKLVTLPFEVRFGDDKDEVRKKLGMRPHDTSGSSLWFRTDAYVMHTAFNSRGKLFACSFKRLSVDAQEEVRFERYVKAQKGTCSRRTRRSFSRC